MNKGRSRLALFGVLVLAVCLTASLLAGSADAKKKKKKKSSNSVTLTKSTPTPIPAGDGTNQVAGVATVSFTVGKKQGKGKVVATNSLMPTYQLTDPAGFLTDIDLKVVAPDGTTVFLDNPSLFFGDDGLTTIGPLTQSAKSTVGYCEPNPSPPPNGCPDGDPDNTLAPPFAGTARDVDMSIFNGVQARGTWLFKALNFSTESTHVLSLASIHMNLVAAPK